MTAPPINIAIASSEVIPFAKTGGLADVAGTLPLELAKLGHQVAVFLPAYRSVIEDPRFNFEIVLPLLQIPIGQKLVTGSVLKCSKPANEFSAVQSADMPDLNENSNSHAGSVDQRVDFYLIQQSEYFDRAGIYGEHGHDYSDNCERFSFFSRSVLETIRLLNLPIDLVHANDWQTGLIPALLKTDYETVPNFENVPSVFTIHNLAYQGRFMRWDLMVTGLDWKYFNWQQMEFHGDISLLKTGIVFADQLTTVSPRYAKEIQTDEMGCGLEGVLRDRNGHLTGIMNGIDTSNWNPETDQNLAKKYSVANWEEGKRVCKENLQQNFGLEPDPHIPLVGLVGRLASQKGWSILLPVIEHWLQTIDVQWIVLGTGDPVFESELKRLATQFPQRLSVCLKFSDELAHKVEAGSDMFLMPSLYEPCGLNQLFSLRYGTVPIVRATGGLADSIVDANQETLAASTANGFVFENFTSIDLETAVARAVVCFMDRFDEWKQIVETGMSQDWSWRRSASRYVEVYQRAIAAAKSTSHQPS